MSLSVASRRLRYRDRSNRQEGEILVSISKPKPVDPASVAFNVDPETAESTVTIEGLPEPIAVTIYGADEIQALQLSLDVDPLLRRVSRDYELFFVSGEPYFEATSDADESAT